MRGRRRLDKLQARINRFTAVFEPDKSILDGDYPRARFAYRSLHDEPIFLGQPFAIHNR